MSVPLLQPFAELCHAGRKEDFPFSGRQFYLRAVTSPVTLIFYDDQRTERGRATDAETDFSCYLDAGVALVQIQSPVTQTVYWIEAAEGVKPGSNVNAKITQAALTDNIEPVELPTVAVEALPADAARHRLVLTAHRDNAGAIAIGGPSLTADNAARWLEPGESYIETEAAPAAVYGLAENDGDLLCIEVA